MKAAWYEENGPARKVLVVGELPKPELLQGEVLVRVIASGVNPSDVKSRAGRPMVGPRVIPHSDGAGVIKKVGPGVSPERIGQRVWIWNAQWRRANGTAAEYVALPERQAIRLPDNTGFNEGACLGIPALTAIRALTVDGSVLGKRVMITGGAGAVGSYAIQMAKLLGAAEIITTVSSGVKGEIARRLGADHVIDYKTEDVPARIKAITSGAGVDRVIEVDAAGNIHYLPQIIAKDGNYVVYGSGKNSIPFEFGPMIVVGAAVRFFIVYELGDAVRESCSNALNAYLQAGLLKHSVSQSYSIDEIADAHEAVESGKVTGNVVISFDQ